MFNYYFIAFFALISAVLGDNTRVTLTQGTLIGNVMQTVNSREFYAFRGIPYAKPPIGKLRFKPPQPAGPWTGILDATNEGPMCPQFDLIFTKKILGQEDCLFLNVYTPKISETGNEKFPVMVFVHGGAFMHGSGQTNIYSPVKLLDRDVILVTLNYRLGAFGFFSTGDDVAPGNNGLYDQVEALKWVQQNIANFGGDPGKVTLFGQSAGGASVSHLVMSPKAKGLFQAAIMQSGNSLSSWALNDEPKRWAKFLAFKLACPAHNSQAILYCLSKKSMEEIITGQEQTRLTHSSMIFTPVVENTADGFLPDHPFKLLKSNKFNKMPIMIGATRDEGAFNIAFYMLQFDIYSSEFLEQDLVQLLSHLDGPANPKNMTKALLEHYFKNVDRNNKVQVRNAIIQMFSDRFFLVGPEIFVQTASQYDFPIYSYLLTHRGKSSFTNAFGITEDLGVAHADDIQYLFDAFFFKKLEGDDIKMSDIILDLWTNFARTHDPTPGNNLPFKWLQTGSTSRYLDINLYPKMVNKKLTDNIEFWTKIEKKTDPSPSWKLEL